MPAGVTTVKLDRRAREELERLRARLQLESGVKPTLQDLLDALIRLGWRRRGELVAELQGGWRPVENPEELIDSLAADLGTSDAAAEVDKVLYGGEEEGGRRVERAG